MFDLWYRFFNPKDKEEEQDRREGPVLLVGNPNVGKSLIFNYLTGSYVTVSNYPGTTVEISRGEMEAGLEVIDTPGIYSLRPVTEEERVTRMLLFQSRPLLLVNVIEALKLERTLPLILELMETGLSLLLVLNMMDEAEAGGITFQSSLLERELGVRVIEAVSTRGLGLNRIRRYIIGCSGRGGR